MQTLVWCKVWLGQFCNSQVPPSPVLEKYLAIYSYSYCQPSVPSLLLSTHPFLPEFGGVWSGWKATTSSSSLPASWNWASSFLMQKVNKSTRSSYCASSRPSRHSGWHPIPLLQLRAERFPFPKIKPMVSNIICESKGEGLRCFCGLTFCFMKVKQFFIH